MDSEPLTPEEQTALDSFVQKVRQDPKLNVFQDATLVQFMMARKFEEDRAYELIQNSLKWRSDRKIGAYLSLTQTIATELKTQKVLIPPQSRDNEGSQIVYYRPGLAKKNTKADDFCLSIFYLLQNCIRDPETQRKGFLFICDLRGTKLLQVDRKLVRSIVDMLSNKFPARLKKVLLLEPPTFFNMAFRIVRPLIPAKYLEKLAPAKMADLRTYVDADKLLTDYGGSLQFNQGAYVDQLMANDQQVQQQFLQPQQQQTTPLQQQQTPQPQLQQQQTPVQQQPQLQQQTTPLQQQPQMQQGLEQQLPQQQIYASTPQGLEKPLAPPYTGAAAFEGAASR